MEELKISAIDKYDLTALYNKLSELCGSYTSIPAKELSVEDLPHASERMAAIVNLRSFLMDLKTGMEVRVRLLKTQKNSEYQINLDKKKIIEAYIDILDNVYQCLSRQITVYQMTQDEIRMM